MHESVLVAEVLALLQPSAGGVYVDATLGGGGHAEAILRKAGGDALLLGIDRDGEAVERCRNRLREFEGRARCMHGSFADVEQLVLASGVGRVDGVLLDIGVSSFQLDQPGRGFSFNSDGPLDMRMDRQSGRTAADLVNELSEKELSDLFHFYGEERKARPLARAIVEERGRAPFRTTLQLAELVARVVGGRKGRLHPATRAFQALRIAVNDELGQLRTGLAGALNVLKEGGRLAVISFHRLEDRIAKEFGRKHEGRWESQAAGGVKWVGELPPVRIVTRKSVVPALEEVERNPRARSSRLRVVERVAQPYDRRAERKRGSR